MVRKSTLKGLLEPHWGQKALGKKTDPPILFFGSKQTELKSLCRMTGFAEGG